jgi:hypothetical protein
MGSSTAFGADALDVEAGSQIGMAGPGVGHQMPDDDQRGTADRDEGLLASAVGQTPVTLPRDGVGPARTDGGLAQHPGQAAVAVPGEATALLLAGRPFTPGLSLAQEARGAAVGNPVMSRPIPATMTAAAVAPTPGIATLRSTAAAKGASSSAILPSSSVMSASLASRRAGCPADTRDDR